MDKKAEILSMVEEVYVGCIIDYLHVLVKDAHRVALSVQNSEDFLAENCLNGLSAERVPED